MVTIQKSEYKDFGACLKLTNKIISMMVTVDYGPRIIYFGYENEKNELCEYDPFTKKVRGENWCIRGGHRLWHSPEDETRSYIPDNKPVTWEETNNGLLITQQTEPWAQIKKQILINIDPQSPKAELLHILTNENAWPVKLSAWAITQMAPGGLLIASQNANDTGLLPNRKIILWPYTKMNDPRLIWGEKYIFLKHDPTIANPIKFGIAPTSGQAAYYNSGTLFIKNYIHKNNAEYPDLGTSFEIYANGLMVEMETLSPLTLLAPGQMLKHPETWELHREENQPNPADEASVSRVSLGRFS